MSHPPSSTTQSDVAAHYSREGLLATIEGALRAIGKDPSHLQVEDIAPIDQFHSRGYPATLELASMAGLKQSDRVLDVGGGLGGPARVIATIHGCDVTVLDLTPEFCAVGETITEWMKLENRVRFQLGNAMEIPFEAEHFDVAWTQHSSMNMADKARLYSEVHRVLRPGGRFAFHEIFAGPVTPIVFPVPWASRPELSSLIPATEIRQMIVDAGFVEKIWLDITPLTLAWAEERLACGPAPGLGLHLLLGPSFKDAFDGFHRNLLEQRIQVIEAVFERS